MEEAFGKIVTHIFNNWSALKLAVDHSMGGPNSKQVLLKYSNMIYRITCYYLQTAVDCMNYMTQFCLYENNLDIYKIQEALEDLMDEEFETICEDDSPKGMSKIKFNFKLYNFDKFPEIAAILFRFVQLMRDGNLQQCEEEFQKLPTMNPNWINSSASQLPQNTVSSRIQIYVC